MSIFAARAFPAKVDIGRAQNSDLKLWEKKAGTHPGKAGMGHRTLDVSSRQNRTYFDRHHPISDSRNSVLLPVGSTWILKGRDIEEYVVNMWPEPDGCDAQVHVCGLDRIPPSFG